MPAPHVGERAAHLANSGVVADGVDHGRQGIRPLTGVEAQPFEASDDSRAVARRPQRLHPFDLQPHRYKRLSDGVVIYAVGPDGLDDGGAVHTPGPGPLAADIGVRLWDVAHRRQPPKPADDGMKEP